MSKATKRKHVLKQVLQDDLELPVDNEAIVKVLASKGNNLHEVESEDGSVYLASMPTKFRKNVWVKRGDFLLVAPIDEGDRVRAEMIKVLTPDHVRYYKKNAAWPARFDTKQTDEVQKDEGGSDDDDDLVKNTNRPKAAAASSSSGDSSDGT